jgi:hypothetical protein
VRLGRVPVGAAVGGIPVNGMPVGTPVGTPFGTPVGTPVNGTPVGAAVPEAHNSTADELPVPIAVLRQTVPFSLVYHAQPPGKVGSASMAASKALPAAPAALLHVAAPTIRDEEAGHWLLPSTLQVYAPARPRRSSRSQRTWVKLRTMQRYYACTGTARYAGGHARTRAS